jgi:hypothetical protein
MPRDCWRTKLSESSRRGVHDTSGLKPLAVVGQAKMLWSLEKLRSMTRHDGVGLARMLFSHWFAFGLRGKKKRKGFGTKLVAFSAGDR